MKSVMPVVIKKYMKNKYKLLMYNHLPLDIIKNIMIHNTIELFYKIITRRTINNLKKNYLYTFTDEWSDDNIKKCNLCRNNFNDFTGYVPNKKYTTEYYDKYYVLENKPICNKCNNLLELKMNLHNRKLDRINKKNLFVSYGAKSYSYKGMVFHKKVNKNNLFYNKKYLICEVIYNKVSDILDYTTYENDLIEIIRNNNDNNTVGDYGRIDLNNAICEFKSYLTTGYIDGLDEVLF